MIFFFLLTFFIHVLEGQEKIKRYSLVVECGRMMIDLDFFIVSVMLQSGVILKVFMPVWQ